MFSPDYLFSEESSNGLQTFTVPTLQITYRFYNNVRACIIKQLKFNGFSLIVMPWLEVLLLNVRKYIANAST